MKILAKLLVGFLSIALLCAVVGAVGFSEVGTLGASIGEMASKTIPSIKHLNIIAKEFLKVKVAVRNMANPIGFRQAGFLEEQYKAVEDARAAYRPVMELYEKESHVAEESDLWDVVRENLTTGAAYTNKTIEETRKLAGLTDPAAIAAQYETINAHVWGENRLALDRLIKSLDDLIEFVDRYYGQERAEKSLAASRRAGAVLVSVTLAALAISIALGLLLGNAISSSLKRTVSVLDKIARGDLSERLEVRTRDEFAQVASSLSGVEDNIAALIKDTDSLVASAVDGRLSTRADASRHTGDYRRVIEGINRTLDAVTGPMGVAARYIDAISRGDLPEKITDSFNGDFNLIKENLNRAIDSIQALIADSNMLADAAVAGVLQTRADGSRHQGDYRKIIEGVNRTLDLVIGPVNEVIEIFKRLAEGDMTASVDGAYMGDFDVLKQSLNDSLDAINDTLSQINLAVDQVAEGAGQVSQASQALSQGATEQASSLEEITSSTTEISSQTRQNTENALKMNSLAKEAQENALKGNSQMKELVAAMSDINTSAEEIKKVVKAIDDISFQINLLALNANVEAARAGKYGKGFAVVAEEVRNLAVRSANSVKETTRMVEEAISNIQHGNDLVDRTAQQLDEIVGGASQVAELAEEVATAGREQTQGLDQIAIGLNQIDQVTQSNTASAEESASASEELSSQAQQVKAMLARFTLRGRDAYAGGAPLAARQIRAAAPAKPQIPSIAVSVRPPDAARTRKPPTRPAQAKAPRPADIISLDDGNFGKF